MSPSQARLHVLWLIKGLGLGGAEQLLATHAAFGDHDRFRYRAAYVVPGKDALVPSLERSGVEVVRLGADGGTWVGDLAKRIRAGDADVIHVHSPLVGAISRLIVRSMPKGKRPRLVYTEHNRWPMYRRPTRLANRVTYPLDDAKLAVSADVLASLPRRARSRVEVLVHGIDIPAVRRNLDEREEARQELGIGDGEVLVGTVANLRPEKGYPYLLHAARRVIDARPAVRFVSVGVGPRMDEAKALHAELDLRDRFRFLGLREDAKRLMAGFDVFCLSSVHEGLPVALMEAMALGRPTVGTRVGGVPEAVRDGVEGFLVDPARPDLLADALLKMVADPALMSRMGRSAAERSEMFDAARAVSRIETLYSVRRP